MSNYFSKKFKSFIYAFNGLKAAIYLESNLFIHFIISIITLIFAFLFDFSSIEWLILLLNIALVISAELINTSIEKLCDLYSTAKNEQIRIIKDVAASSVLVTAIFAFTSGLILFIPKLITYFYLLIVK